MRVVCHIKIKVCPPVRGDNTRALARGLFPVQADKLCPVCTGDNLELKPVDYPLGHYLSIPAGRLGGNCLNGRCRGMNVRCNRFTDMCVCKRGCGDPAAVCLRRKSLFFCLHFFFYFNKGEHVF